MKKLQIAVLLMGMALAWAAASVAGAQAGGLNFGNGKFAFTSGSDQFTLTGTVSTTTCVTNGQMQRFGNEVYFCDGSHWTKPTCGGTSGTCTVAGSIDKLGNTYCSCNGTNWLTWCGTSSTLGGCTALGTYLASAPVADPATATDGVNGDIFGAVVALDGTTAAIANGAANNMVYVYTYSGTSWSQQQEIAFTDDTYDSVAGMALSGDTLLIAGFNDDVYVYTRSGGIWSYTDDLLSPNYGDYDGFGYSVGAAGYVGSIAISGTTALVGDQQYDLNTSTATGPGFAALYTKSGGTWGLTATLTAADGADGDRFGAAVAFPGTGTLAVSAAISGTDATDTQTGAVYVYTGSGASWSQQAKIIPADVSPSDQFGVTGVAFDGDTLVAGSLNAMGVLTPIIYGPLCTTYGEPYCTLVAEAGGNVAAYVFHRSGSTWTQQGKLGTSDTDFFGPVSFGLKGDVAVVGGENVSMMVAYTGLVSTTTHGTAAYYTRSGSTWTTSPTYLFASDDPVDDGSGGTSAYYSSVAVDGCTGGVLMGTTATSPQQEIGNAYFFTPGQAVGTNPCTLPWGGTISSTASVTAYAYGTDTSCPSQTRVCGNGKLVGSYTHQSCTIDSDACHSDASIAMGTSCGDGTVYAGTISGNKIFTTPCDAGKTYSAGSCGGTASTYMFNTTGSGSTSYTSADDGQTNSAGLAGLGSAYAAATYCEGLTADGHSDWYLPAINELMTTVTNMETTGGTSMISFYWSSTDATSTDAYIGSWAGSGSPVSDTAVKDAAATVRCIRHN